MGSLAPWIAAARPKTLPAAVSPIMVGTVEAMEQGRIDWFPVFICLGFALFIQIGTNMANDYFDFIKGADTESRLGPERQVAAGKIAPRTMLLVAIAIFIAAFLLGLNLVAYRGWELLVIGVLSIIFGYAYTGGPYPLAYHGLGDIFVIVFFGLVATVGTFYVLTGELTTESCLLGLALGCLANNILVVNNYRDLETDAQAGKRTLVVRLGRNFALKQYRIQFLVAYLMVGCYFVLTEKGWTLLPCLSIPLAWKLGSTLSEAKGYELNGVLAKSAQLLLLFSVLTVIGVAIG